MKYRSINRDIFAVIAITLITVALVFVLPSGWVVGRILTLPLLLVLPGYALTTALFVGPKFGGLQRLLFSIALSFAIMILGGLVLNATAWGLQTNSWALLLSSITLAACAVALARRRGQNISTSGWLRAGNIGLNFRQMLLLGVAALIVCGAVAVSIIGAQRQPYPGFTQLSILPSSAASGKKAVSLGVDNMESTAMNYRLAVNIDGKVVKEWPSIDLDPNNTWNAILVLPATGYSGPERVEADLYRADTPTKIYRHVVLWLVL